MPEVHGLKSTNMPEVHGLKSTNMPEVHGLKSANMPKVHDLKSANMPEVIVVDVFIRFWLLIVGTYLSLQVVSLIIMVCV